MTHPHPPFSERPSAPPELLPGLIGAVTSSVRYTSFVRDRELRDLVLDVHADCLVELPVGTLIKQPSSLSEIFTGLRCPVVHLGYLCGHRQSWENRGTHLGEVVHSVALGPGESRNIAFVNWRRRQLVAREEQTRVDERLSAVFVQNRALEEITTAVATEHQEGETQIEAGTAATAAGLVVAGTITGGVAGGVIGSFAAPGAGTGVGAAVGTAVGSVVGMAAGGLVMSGARALGTIEAETDGNRDIVADLNQRIALTTSQTASAVRSLWSTAVIEDTQAESVTATTSNITNYNHMHALNLEYFEVLQHYEVQLAVESLQPLLYLPFTALDFTNFRFIRDYWDIVRVHIDDEGLREQGDSYFVSEEVPSGPDLLPVPALPEEPPEPEPLTLAGLKIDVLFDALPFEVDMGLTLTRDGQEIAGEEAENAVRAERLDGFDFGNRYTFDNVEDAAAVTGVVLSRNPLIGGGPRTPYRIRVAAGRLRRGNRELRALEGVVIRPQGVLQPDAPRNTFVPWNPAAGVADEDTAAREEFEAAQRARARIIAKNAHRQAAFDALVKDIARFKLRLQKLVLRRRHFFTRVILGAVEPEEITQLLESVTIGHVDAGAARLRLNAIAHTIPLGLTAGAFVLKLKRLDAAAIQELIAGLGLTTVPAELTTLVEYAASTLDAFKARVRGLRRTDDVYVPTGGLFSEAVLGRSNSAEYLDMQRFFNWQDSPIPHQPPAIEPVSTASRFQRADVSVTVPEGDLQVINPVAFPDPTGLTGVLTAIQNGAIFRDMSGATQLAGVLGSLATLAGQLGQAAGSMTGQAGQEALRAAGEVGKAAAGLAQSLADLPVTSGPPSTITNDGAALNASRDLDAQAVAALTPPGQPLPAAPPSATTEEIPRNVAGLPPAAPRRPTRRRSQRLSVFLTVDTPRGKPIHFADLADVRKVLRLVHEQEEPLTHEFTSINEFANPTYLVPLEWPRRAAELTVTLEVAGFAFLQTESLDIPDNAVGLNVRAKFTADPVTKARERTVSRTQATVTETQRTLKVSLATAEAITKVLNAGIDLEFGDSIADEDSVTGGTSTTITETLLVPVYGQLDLRTSFRFD